MKKNIGNVLALYPTPAVVVGTEVNGKVNWLLAQKPWIVPIPGTKRNSEAGNRARQCGAFSERRFGDAFLVYGLPRSPIFLIFVFKKNHTI